LGVVLRLGETIAQARGYALSLNAGRGELPYWAQLRVDSLVRVGRVNVTLERESGRIYSAATGIEKRTRYTPQRLYTLSEYDLNNRVA